MKFSAKLTLLFSAIILVTGAGISYFVYISNLRTLEAHMEDLLKNQAFHTMHKIDMIMYERLDDVRDIADDSVIRSKNSGIEQITKKLIQFKNDKGYDSLAFYDLNKTNIADTSGQNIGMKHSSSEFWKGIDEGMERAVVVVKSDFLNKAIFRFVSVVKDRNGNPIGYVVARLPLEYLNNILSQAVGIFNIEKDFWISMVDKDGLIIYSNHDKEAVLKETLPEWGFIKESINKGINTGMVKHTHSTKRGEEILVFSQEQGYQDFKGIGWTLTLEIPTRVAFASAFELRNRILVISVIVSLFVFLMVGLLSGRVSKTLERLSAASEMVAKGNLDVKVDAASNDETGRLAEKFNRMVADLKEQRGKLLLDSSELEVEKDYLEKLHNSLGAVVFSVKIPEQNLC